jgi:hypothetical protein
MAELDFENGIVPLQKVGDISVVLNKLSRFDFSVPYKLNLIGSTISNLLEFDTKYPDTNILVTRVHKLMRVANHPFDGSADSLMIKAIDLLPEDKQITLANRLSINTMMHLDMFDSAWCSPERLAKYFSNKCYELVHIQNRQNFKSSTLYDTRYDILDSESEPILSKIYELLEKVHEHCYGNEIYDSVSNEESDNNDRSNKIVSHEIASEENFLKIFAENLVDQNRDDVPNNITNVLILLAEKFDSSAALQVLQNLAKTGYIDYIPHLSDTEYDIETEEEDEWYSY